MVVIAAVSFAVTTSSHAQVEAQRWTLTKVVGNDLLIQSSSGDCEKFERIEVSESSGTVGVSVLNRILHKDVCLGYGITECHRVTLAAPLGDRALHYGRGPRASLAEPKPAPNVLPGAREGHPVPTLSGDCDPTTPDLRDLLKGRAGRVSLPLT